MNRSLGVEKKRSGARGNVRGCAASRTISRCRARPRHPLRRCGKEHRGSRAPRRRRGDYMATATLFSGDPAAPVRLSSSNSVSWARTLASKRREKVPRLCLAHTLRAPAVSPCVHLSSGGRPQTWRSATVPRTRCNPITSRQTAKEAVWLPQLVRATAESPFDKRRTHAWGGEGRGDAGGQRSRSARISRWGGGVKVD